MSTNLGQESFLAKNIVLPIEQYEENINHNFYHKYFPNRNRIMPDGNITDNVNEIKSINEQTTLLISPQGANSNQNINWLKIILVVYFIGASFFLVRFLANFVWIFAYVLKHKTQHISGMKVVRFEKNISPFSFLNYVFISKKQYPEEDLSKIIAHEKVHIQQKHSIDLILLELLLVFQWFNPFVWFYKRAIKITHEYLADNGTLNSGIDLPSYQYSLLNQALHENNFEMVSSYNFSIKKRIKMMMQKRSPKLATLKLAIALPIISFLFMAFAFKIRTPKGDANNNIENKLQVNGDTTIKKVNVPVEYLKLLEGEYVSTNEPGRVRKIIFTELLGTLFGNDNGYTYKIIPVGGEKFINPDDHASLVFNSKDKNEIRLLLFGRINLKKVKIEKATGEVQRRSMAFTLANLMLKNGVETGLSYYKKAKDSTNYFLTEIEMSYAGYQLLESNKVKEAVALLKLDTELFSDFYNSYDSYGDALLLLGDKTQAIENFKKSIKLNPGSKNGLKKLKELNLPLVKL
jgi:tetratricopeptide (TPR) repeat protein